MKQATLHFDYKPPVLIGFSCQSFSKAETLQTEHINILLKRTTIASDLGSKSLEFCLTMIDGCKKEVVLSRKSCGINRADDLLRSLCRRRRIHADSFGRHPWPPRATAQRA